MAGELRRRFAIQDQQSPMAGREGGNGCRYDRWILRNKRADEAAAPSRSERQGFIEALIRHERADRMRTGRETEIVKIHYLMQN